MRPIDAQARKELLAVIGMMTGVNDGYVGPVGKHTIGQLVMMLDDRCIIAEKALRELVDLRELKELVKQGSKAFNGNTMEAMRAEDDYVRRKPHAWHAAIEAIKLLNILDANNNGIPPGRVMIK